MMRIALDAMGGDHGPQPNVDGAIAALETLKTLEIVLVGDEAQLEQNLVAANACRDRISIQPAVGVIGMEEKPTEALRRKPRSSINVCWELMSNKQVDAIVSAGNTGAVVASGLRKRQFLKQVRRPGIAVALPTIKGRSVLMDVGANPSARPEHLYQYAVMGAVYAREVLGIENPKIGLMNIGSEDSKGNELYRDTHKLLTASRLQDRYIGNIEGRGLYQGDADVLICEGFVGNVVLKVSEGMADFMMKVVAKEIIGNLVSEQEMARKTFQALAQQYHHSVAGGAPLLGIDGICIICHGSSNTRSIANALQVATTLKDCELNSHIAAELAEPVSA
jgi:glycerol-3-phosphate acyltransferase PlsX